MHYSSFKVLLSRTYSSRNAILTNAYLGVRHFDLQHYLILRTFLTLASSWSVFLFWRIGVMSCYKSCVFFQMLTDDVTCLQSTRDNIEIYKHINTTAERSMLSLRHEVTETQSSVEKRKTNRPSTELLFMELN